MKDVEFILGSHLKEARSWSTSFCAQQCQISNCSETGAIPGHADPNSLSGNEAFLNRLNKGLAGSRGEGMGATTKQPAATMTSEG